MMEFAVRMHPRAYRRTEPALATAGGLAWATITIFILSGCGDPGAEYAPKREILATGVERVTYAALEPRRLAFDTIATWDVWNPDGPYLFNEISDVVGGTESFFLLDGGNRQVVDLAPDGSLRGVFGREGSGPGEFRSPLHLTFDDEKLWVSDVGNRRFSVYGLDGTYLRDVRWPGASRLVNRFAITPRGSILHGGMWPLTVAELADQKSLFYLAEFPGEGEWEEGRAAIYVDTLVTMKSAPYLATEIRSEEGDIRMWFGLPEFSPRLLWAAGEEQVVTVVSDEYRFEMRYPHGEIFLEVVAPTPELRVTEAHKEWFFRYEAERRLRQYGSFTLTSDSRARLPFARQMPAITGIAMDRMGRVWVLASTDRPGVTRLDVFDREGDYMGHLGEMPLPAAINCDGYVLVREMGGEDLDRFRVGFVRWAP